MNDGLKPETQLIQDGPFREERYGAVIPPLYQNSTFTFDSWDALDAAFEDRTGTPTYSRILNPTVQAAERHLAALAGTEKARLFPSGMGAISAALLHCLRPGDHLITLNNVYGPAANLMGTYLPEKMGIQTTFVDGGDLTEVGAALRPETRVLYLESPNSARFGVQDIEALCALVKPRGIRVLIDNTWATPLFQKPLGLGVDLELHSVSKYLSGHSDLVAGVVLGKAELVDALATREAELLGGKMAPFEAWLLLRSLRTLPARMALHQANGLAVGRFLEAHPAIAEVRHPGLPSHPDHALAARQLSGFSSLFSFTLKTDHLPAIKTFFDSLKLFGRGVSWGGHESLIYSPVISAVKEQPPERLRAMGLAPGLMRAAVGLESPEDLTADLGQALEKSQAMIP